MKIENITPFLHFTHGLSCETRIRILYALVEKEHSASELLSIVGGTQPNLSQHLSCLVECGFLTKRTHGRFNFFSLKNEEIKAFLSVMDSTVESMHWTGTNRVCGKEVD
ncbi:MAG: metalloregulator ArsR/SmtB family transcription factor [Streptococcaceae bacterium]|jgi:DNA-binding transcriptional ArsR family regulator|nr:metalloregulator ArsR/SmtB family transcription factor [Streptococcaceae bacterium]